MKQVEKKESISSLTNQLDTVFSQYIRLRNADKQGMVQCYTSGKWMHWKKAQAGHFISRRHYSTRWNEVNVQVQSVKENVFNQGNAPVFQRNLIGDYGKQTIDFLFIQRDQPIKLDRMTLRFKIDYYSKMVQDLKLKLGISD